MSIDALLPPTDFPMLSDVERIYFDAATMTPCPQQVIEPLGRYYRIVGGIPNRGAHRFSVNATEYQNNAREVVGKFFHAPSSSISFTPNNTYAAYIAANLFPLEKGESILLSPLLHHSTLLPWIKRSNSNLNIRIYFPVASSGRVTTENILEAVDPTVRVAVLPYASIAYGMIAPLNEIIPALHEHDIRVIIDGTHAAGHVPINLTELDCDVFYCSGNIGLMGPLGSGILYVKPDLDRVQEPPIVGDGIIKSVSYHEYSLLSPPITYEPGFPDVASEIALASGIQYLEKTGIERIYRHEQALISQLLTQIKEIPSISIYGDEDPQNRIGILGFNIESVHPHDVAMILDESSNIQVRSGYLCAHPFIQCLNDTGLVQVSLHGYNSSEQIDRFIQKLSAVAKDLV